MTKPSGAILYEGPSLINGEPIVAIVTFDSSNSKIGNLVQVWIIRSDMSPMDAVNTGHDDAICGSCPLRGVIRSAKERTAKNGPLSHPEFTNKDRACYVLVAIAPQEIYYKYKNGGYKQLSDSHAKYCLGKGIRYGAYGESVAVPRFAYTKLEKMCKGKSKPGYTHEHKNPEVAANWSKILMASVHSLEMAKKAQDNGWRTFRTISSLDLIQDNEIVCPASKEGGYRANCAMCGACNGRKDMNDLRKNVVIVSHGGSGKSKRVNQLAL